MLRKTIQKYTMYHLKAAYNVRKSNNKWPFVPGFCKFWYQYPIKVPAIDRVIYYYYYYYII